MKKSAKELNIFAANIRKAALRAMNAFHGGHVGGSMSMAELMAVLYGEAMKIDPKNPQWEGRDWLVVSKGHCGPAVYGTLACKGYFPMEELDTLKLQVASQSQTNADLRDAVEHSEDPTRQKDIARNELGLAAPGEKVIIFTD